VKSEKNYKPWIAIQDFTSRGRVSRSPGWKSDRVHHFMSDWELRFFYILESSTVVHDIFAALVKTLINIIL
jgi:hypothetical protein